MSSATIFIPCHTIVVAYYGITLAVRVSIPLSVCHLSVFSFPNVNLSKSQWIFNKLCVCINILQIWFEIVNGQISPIFDSYLSAIRPYFHFWMITSVNINGFSPNLMCALILWSPGLGLLMGKFRLFLTELSTRNTSIFPFLDDNFSNIYEFSPNLVCALIL